MLLCDCDTLFNKTDWSKAKIARISRMADVECQAVKYTKRIIKKKGFGHVTGT